MRADWAEALLVAAGLLTTAYVPAAHLLKNAILAEPRFDHDTVLRTVAPRIEPNDLVFASSDRFLVPLIGSFRAQAQAGVPVKGVWVFPSRVNWDATYARHVVDVWICELALRGGNGIVWGIDAGNVASFDEAAGEARLAIPAGRQGRLSITFRPAEVLYRVHDGMYLRGAVVAVTDEAGAPLFPRDPRLSCP